MQTFVSIKPLFYVLRILSELIKFNQLTYSFDYLQGKLPESFTKIWKHNYQVYCIYNLRNCRDFCSPSIRFKIFSKHPLLYSLFGTTFLMNRNKFVAHLRSFCYTALKNNSFWPCFWRRYQPTTLALKTLLLLYYVICYICLGILIKTRFLCSFFSGPRHI